MIFKEYIIICWKTGFNLILKTIYEVFKVLINLILPFYSLNSLKRKSYIKLTVIIIKVIIFVLYSGYSEKNLKYSLNNYFINVF